jgi:hypothetical protein
MRSYRERNRVLHGGNSGTSRAQTPTGDDMRAALALISTGDRAALESSDGEVAAWR